MHILKWLHDRLWILPLNQLVAGRLTLILLPFEDML